MTEIARDVSGARRSGAAPGAGGPRRGAATPPLRCVVVTGFAGLGGAERWLLTLLDTAAGRLDPEVWLLEEGPLRGALESRGVPVTVLPTGRRPAALASRNFDLARRLRRSGAEVVLANGIKPAAAVAPAARLVGVPVCWAKHDFSWDRELARPLGLLCDSVLATSSSVAAATGRTDAVLVPPPKPTASVDDRPAAQAFWAGRGVDTTVGPTLAVVNRLVGFKGTDTAVQALAEPAAHDWRLVVVGPVDPAEPWEQRRLRGIADELGVADRVVFAGEIAEAGRHLAAFDAVAVLTRDQAGRYGREGYSIVSLEALTSGVPLIGASGNPEVERMATAAGCVVPPDDPGAVADALGHLLDSDVRRRCREGGAAVLAAHPDEATCARRVVATLADLVGRPGAGLGGPPMSVLTCLRDEAGHVDDVVSEVVSQLGPDDEYLVVDDGSVDRTREELAAWVAGDPRLRLLDGGGRGAPAARNIGFAAARHPQVACIDAGCVPAAGWLDALRAAYAEDEPADLVVGAYDVDGGDPVRDASRLALFPAVAEARRPDPLVRLSGSLTGRRFDRRRLDTRSMACTVAAWRRAGGFDEGLRGAEDADFGRRVLVSGGTSVLALDATVTWLQSGRLSTMARTYHRYGRGGGRSGSWALIGRDVVRGAAYVGGPLLAARGGTAGRVAVAAGAAVYLATPLRRAVAERADPAAVALVPVVLAVKDVAKATGCLQGVLARMRTRSTARSTAGSMAGSIGGSIGGATAGEVGVTGGG